MKKRKQKDDPSDEESTTPLNKRFRCHDSPRIRSGQTERIIRLSRFQQMDLVSFPAAVCELDFSGCQLSPNDVAAICQFLDEPATPSIRSLSLVDTGLRDNSSFKSLSNLLSRNTTLLRLDLSKNNLGWAENYPLYKGCQSNKTLQELILNEPDCRHLDGVSLVVMVSLWLELFRFRSSSLTRLSIGSAESCRLSQHLVDQWRDACQKQENLVSLGCRNLELCPSVQYWLSLNRYGIRQVIRDGDTYGCQRALLKMAKDNTSSRNINSQNDDAVYHLIRNNPDAILSHWNTK